MATRPATFTSTDSFSGSLDTYMSSLVDVPASAQRDLPPEPTAPIMETRGLNVFYGDFHAVHDVDLSFGRNEITALIGPSGCGKSTVLRCLNRMNDLVAGCRVEGSVSYHDVEIYGKNIDPIEVRRHIGMVFQKPNPFPKSIYDNIAYGPRVIGMKVDDMDAHVEEALRSAALWDEVKDKLKQSAYGLSGGQQQRLCIARTIATKPDVILMDEPCSALDPIATSRIEDLMTELREHLHDHHRHAQHAAGGARLRPHRVLHREARRDDGQPDGPAGRVRPHQADLQQARRRAHRGLHLRSFRLILRPAGLSEPLPLVLGWRTSSQREAHHGDHQRHPGTAAGQARPGRTPVHGDRHRARLRGNDRDAVAEPRRQGHRHGVRAVDGRDGRTRRVHDHHEGQEHHLGPVRRSPCRSSATTPGPDPDRAATCARSRC